MGKKRSAVAGRAWHLLRLALLWARKGGAFRHKLTLDLRAGYLKSLRAVGGGGDDRIRCGDREFSFDETPAFHFKMHRPASLRHLRIPCISTPTVEFDDEDDNGRNFFEWERQSGDVLEIEGGEGCDGEGETETSDEVNCEEGIDVQAEEFIAQFYEQMKLQRQVSYLQYNEMLERGMN